MRKSFRVEYSPEALEDLRAIYSYIAFHLKERETANSQIGRIRREIRALSELPERYAAVDWEPWVSAGMRRLGGFEPLPVFAGRFGLMLRCSP